MVLWGAAGWRGVGAGEENLLFKMIVKKIFRQLYPRKVHFFPHLSLPITLNPLNFILPCILDVLRLGKLN